MWRTYIEVKTVSGLSQWYLPVRGDRAVERRDTAVKREYKKAAMKADQRYYQTDSGPVTQRLVQIGPIHPASFGRLGETSDPVHKLVAIMAKARVSKQTLAWGRVEDTEKTHLSVETAYIRQRLSSSVVTCFGHRLASRMSQVGRGAITASQRRQQWSWEEERSRQERSAAWLSAISGRDIVRRGRFWTS